MNKVEIKITHEILDNFNMSKYEDIFLRGDDQPTPGDEYPFWDMNRYHKYYRILAYLSTFYDNEILVDIGTRRGHSAASLAYNENNIVYTYNDRSDEVPENDVFEKITNIKHFVLSEYHDAGPLGNILGVDEHKDILLKSSLIFMDVDPHNGEKESALFEFLASNDYKGLTIWDDTGSQLRGWFEKISSNINNNQPHITACHLNDYSWSDGGTGVICFGGQEIVTE